MRIIEQFGAIAMAGVTVAALTLGIAQAQTSYPEKPIFMVVPYPPGGPNDIVARSISDKLGKELGQPIVVENKSGAGGNVGTEYMVSSKPDGYTLLLHATPLVVNPLLYPQVKYDPIKSVAPVAMVSIAPLVLVVPAAMPIKSVKDLIAYAKANPGKLNFGTGGAGTGLHLAAELFMSMTDTKMTHIPYQGNAKVMPDLLSGQINVLFSAIGTAIPHIKSGALRALAVTTKVRSKVLPDTPTMDEAGVPGLDFGSWFVVAAPAGTPEPIQQKLNAAIVTAIKSPEVQEKFDRLSSTALPYSLDKTRSFIAEQYTIWGKLIKERGISAK